MSNVLKNYRIMGMSLPMFLIVAVVVFAATYMKVLPSGMVGAFPLFIVLGAILNEIGDRTPIVKDYLGGGPIVIIFGTAALFTYQILPASALKISNGFMKSGATFLDFYIAALITGSMFGMNRKLLIRAAIRYMPAILGGVVVSLAMVGVVGALIGYGAVKAIFYIGLPIMGGGMGAGAVPLSKIFSQSLNIDAGVMLSTMIPAVALGNALSIVSASLLDKLGKARPYLTGNGQLMKPTAADKNEEVAEEKKKEVVDYTQLGIGLLLSTAFFALGTVLEKFIPIHSYALMIISVAVVKALGILPQKYEDGAYQWFRFVMINLTPALLVGIGAAFTDLNAVINALTPTYLLLVAVTVVGAIIGSGIVGMLVNFYFVEASITAGLCMANMGGTGDVAVLSACKRMELMPFAQISSRIGGAFILILATALLGLFA